MGRPYTERRARLLGLILAALTAPLVLPSPASAQDEPPAELPRCVAAADFWVDAGAEVAAGRGHTLHGYQGGHAWDTGYDAGVQGETVTVSVTDERTGRVLTSRQPMSWEVDDEGALGRLDAVAGAGTYLVTAAYDTQEPDGIGMRACAQVAARRSVVVTGAPPRVNARTSASRAWITLDRPRGGCSRTMAGETSVTYRAGKQGRRFALTPCFGPDRKPHIPGIDIFSHLDSPTFATGPQYQLVTRGPKRPFTYRRQDSFAIRHAGRLLLRGRILFVNRREPAYRASPSDPILHHDDCQGLRVRRDRRGYRYCVVPAQTVQFSRVVRKSLRGPARVAP
jgi:hypothetical protein